jgi:DNA primase
MDSNGNINKELILNILNRALGFSKKTSKGNYSFRCPNGCSPLKNKLEINLNTYQYQCWVCGGHKDGIKGSNLTKLLQKSKTNQDLINELKPLINNSKYSSGKFEITEIEKKVELPKEFISLTVQGNNIEYKHAISYLKRRNITLNDIIKYNIGYCVSGKFSNCIIIPSYNEYGTLNYFTARNFDKNSTLKYKNPDISRDIIPFELFINWKLPIILCEGPFDALAIKRNVIPLLGKTIQKSLKKKLVKSEVQKIYIALDKDAMKQALTFCEELLNEGKEVYLVEMEDKDPSDMGFENFTKLIQTTQPLSFMDLFEKKLMTI